MPVTDPHRRQPTKHIDQLRGFLDDNDTSAEMEHGHWETDSADDPMVTTSLRLPKSLLDWVRDQAAAEHVKPTAWIRSLIENNRAGGSGLEERVSVLETLLATLVDSARTKRPSPAMPVPLGDKTRHATAKPPLPNRVSVAGWPKRH